MAALPVGLPRLPVCGIEIRADFCVESDRPEVLVVGPLLAVAKDRVGVAALALLLLPTDDQHPGGNALLLHDLLRRDGRGKTVVDLRLRRAATGEGKQEDGEEAGHGQRFKHFLIKLKHIGASADVVGGSISSYNQSISFCSHSVCSAASR